MQDEMIAGLFACFLMGKMIYFPETPLPLEVQRGAKIYAQHKGIERTLLDDRVELGRWFNGHTKREVESAIWLSPGMASRWLGYLQAKEKWDDETLQSRWETASKQLDGKLTFVVQLAAFPKLGGLDMEPTGKADPAEVANVRFLFTSGPGLPETHEKSYVPWDQNKTVAKYHPAAKPIDGKPLRLEPTVTLLASWQSREGNLLERFNWTQAIDWAEPFRGEFDKPLDAPMFPIGEYHAAWYLVSVDLGSLPIHPLGFELRVFSPQKERIAHFELLRLP
jgi:hypothetical protein